MSVESEFRAIYKYISHLPAFSDHEHHQTDAFFAQGMSLDRALSASYVAWTGFVPPPAEATPASRAKLLDNVRFNSYFTWFQRGVQALHGIDEPITLETWDAISQRISRAYAADKGFHWKALKTAGYERLILDAYWNPGDDGGHPEIFTPTFRIDKFLYGYHAEAVAPNDIVPWRHYGFAGGSLDEYVELMRQTIRARMTEAAVRRLRWTAPCRDSLRCKIGGQITVSTGLSSRRFLVANGHIA